MVVERVRGMGLGLTKDLVEVWCEVDGCEVVEVKGR